jgi:hypothetical protein
MCNITLQRVFEELVLIVNKQNTLFEKFASLVNGMWQLALRLKSHSR